MGNRTRPQFFKTKERLRYIEQAAFWRGHINRQDIAATFGLSMAQASADLQAYQETNPNALAYSLSAKCYTWAPKAKPVLHRPDFDDAIALFGIRASGADDASEAGGVPFAKFSAPTRAASLAVQQAVFQAAQAGEVLRILYFSVDGSTAKERRIAPRAFGSNGLRWHVRAWCFEHSDYRDFVLGRIEKVFPPEIQQEELPVDADWEEKVTLLIKINPKLKEMTRRGLEMDFGMQNGQLRYPVRKALKIYAENYFASLWHHGEKQPWFCVLEEEP